MGAADIIRTTLQSPAVRQKIGEAGTRVLDLSRSQEQKDENGGLLGIIWNAVKGLAGWLIQNALKLIQFTLTSLWGLFVQTAQFIWNFNWNASDASLDQQMESLWINVGGLIGGALGNAIGYLACGILPGAVTFVFNQPLGTYLLAKVGPEAAEEAIGNIAALAKGSVSSAIQSLLIWSFKNARKFLKSNNKAITAIFGDKVGKIVDAWGDKGSKPWSFAQAVEEAVESIPSPFLRTLVEELLEEAWEGCVEAGYVLANAADSFLAQKLLSEPPGDEKNRIIELWPNRQINDEKIILAGKEDELRSATTSVLAHYQLIENRDIGTVVGQPVDDYLRAKPQSVRLVIQFYNFDKPPYTNGRNGQTLIGATYAIPDVKRSKCDWKAIKEACGGANGYSWGRYRATGQLSNGRQMQVLGATPQEAEQRLRAFLLLTEADLLDEPTISEDRKKDKLSGGFLKEPTRIYPAYFSIMNQYKVFGAQGSGARRQLGGHYIKKRDRILLWPDEEPPQTQQRIAELLLRPGANE